MGLALQQYVADFDGAYPQQEYRTRTILVGWEDLLQHYTRSKTVFNCPSQANLAGSNLDYFYNFYQLNEYRYSNGQLHSPTGKLEAGLPSASELVVSFDIYNKDPLSVNTGNYEVVQAACGRKVPAVILHSGGANFVYADGHVKRLSVAQQQEIGCDLYYDPAKHSNK
ncbi:hypothetical protein EON80_19660 [bacterium]|nr:MAG: hypothetical protein EON80_19660 [bacterium]